MALPDSDKVIQELTRRFAESLPEFYQRRIIDIRTLRPVFISIKR